MSSRGSPPFANKSFLKLPHPFSLSLPPPLSFSSSLDSSKSAWRVLWTVSIFSLGKMSGQLPRDGTRRGLRGRWYSSGGSPWHRFYPFPRFPAFLTALKSHFQFIPGAFYRIFRFSHRITASGAPANGLARIQQIKRKFVSPRGRSFRVGDRGEGVRRDWLMDFLLKADV